MFTREHILEAVSIHYSLDEIREIGARMRREARRREAIELLFADLMGRYDFEEAAYQHTLVERAERREFREGHRFEERYHERLRWHAMKKDAPQAYEAKLVANRAKKNQWYAKHAEEQRRKERERKKRQLAANPEVVRAREREKQKCLRWCRTSSRGHVCVWRQKVAS